MIERFFSLTLIKTYEKNTNITFLKIFEVFTYIIIYIIEVLFNINVYLSYSIICSLIISIIFYFINIHKQNVAFKHVKEDARNFVSSPMGEVNTILGNKRILPILFPFFTCFFIYGLINQSALYIIYHYKNKEYIDLALIIHAVVLSIKIIVTPSLLLIGLKGRSATPIIEEHILIEENEMNIQYRLLSIIWS